MKRNISLTILFCVLSGFALVGCSPADNTANNPPTTNAGPVVPSTNTTK